MSIARTIRPRLRIRLVRTASAARLLPFLIAEIATAHITTPISGQTVNPAESFMTTVFMCVAFGLAGVRRGILNDNHMGDDYKERSITVWTW